MRFGYPMERKGRDARDESVVDVAQPFRAASQG